MSVRGIHIYGGVLLLTFGVSLVSKGLGIALGGAIILWLGLTWIED